VSLAELVLRLRRDLDGASSGALRVSGLRGSAPAFSLARLLAERPRPVLVIAADAATAESFAADLRFYAGERETSGPLGRRVHYLPGWEVPPFEPLSPTREVVAARAEGFYHLLQTSDPVVVTHPDGRLDLFARGADQAIHHAVQDPAGHNGWSQWKSLGGMVTSTPIVTLDTDDRVELFARNASGSLVHIWQQSPGGCWSPWTDIATMVKTF